jgi:hypothetical protein
MDAAAMTAEVLVVPSCDLVLRLTGLALDRVGDSIVD